MGRSPVSEQIQLKKGPWTPEEDQNLIRYIQKHGYGNWRTLPKNAGLQRCGKSCRLRWTNYLRPDIKRGRFSYEEEETIIQLHSILGNKWSAIAARLAGRTDNEIKNYWNTSIRKKLLRMGIDPVTHIRRPNLLDQMNISMLLGVQPLLNQQLIMLANSLIPSQLKNPSFNHQNVDANNLSITHFPNQFHQLVEPNQVIEEIPNYTPLNVPCVETQDSMNFTTYSSTNLMEEYAPLPSYNFYENSDFCSNNGNQNFSFESSSSMHMISNLTYEDEKMKFAIPDFSY